MSDIMIGDIGFIGPFADEHKVTVEGFVIPKLSASVRPNGDSLILVLDGRFCVEATPEEAAKWVPLIANALAIGEGYPWYGAPSKERPFAPKAMTLEIKPTLTIVPNETPDA